MIAEVLDEAWRQLARARRWCAMHGEREWGAALNGAMHHLARAEGLLGIRTMGFPARWATDTIRELREDLGGPLPEERMLEGAQLLGEALTLTANQDAQEELRAAWLLVMTIFPASSARGDAEGPRGSRPLPSAALDREPEPKASHPERHQGSHDRPTSAFVSWLRAHGLLLAGPLRQVEDRLLQVILSDRGWRSLRAVDGSEWDCLFPPRGEASESGPCPAPCGEIEAKAGSPASEKGGEA